MRDPMVPMQARRMDNRGGAADLLRLSGRAIGMTRALVLGGGGPLGVAWESGLISGFARAGVDLGQADSILGTSAGAIVGARLASGVASAGLADALLDPASAKLGPPPGGSPEAFLKMMSLMREGQGGTRNPAE